MGKFEKKEAYFSQLFWKASNKHGEGRGALYNISLIVAKMGKSQPVRFNLPELKNAA